MSSVMSSRGAPANQKSYPCIRVRGRSGCIEQLEINPICRRDQIGKVGVSPYVEDCMTGLRIFADCVEVPTAKTGVCLYYAHNSTRPCLGFVEVPPCSFLRRETDVTEAWRRGIWVSVLNARMTADRMSGSTVTSVPSRYIYLVYGDEIDFDTTVADGEIVKGKYPKEFGLSLYTSNDYSLLLPQDLSSVNCRKIVIKHAVKHNLKLKSRATSRAQSHHIGHLSDASSKEDDMPITSRMRC
eukprot:GHVT01033159.1.p1 GENE.GHVT01033159.1~~GHVT01033159.1.p1  ORF type:complete len:241 (-),score=3.20 GHVT01033159.1:1298-2020(-)